jgi:hypothetical protein
MAPSGGYRAWKGRPWREPKSARGQGEPGSRRKTRREPCTAAPAPPCLLVRHQGAQSVWRKAVQRSTIRLPERARVQAAQPQVEIRHPPCWQARPAKHRCCCSMLTFEQWLAEGHLTHRDVAAEVHAQAAEGHVAALHVGGACPREARCAGRHGHCDVACCAVSGVRELPLGERTFVNGARKSLPLICSTNTAFRSRTCRRAAARLAATYATRTRGGCTMLHAGGL